MNPTPGPWELSRKMMPQNGEGFYWVTAKRTLHLRIAPCDDGFVKGENEANARLISKAPDLYLALSALVDFHDGIPLDNDVRKSRKNFDDLMEYARKVIAEAVDSLA